MLEEFSRQALAKRKHSINDGIDFNIIDRWMGLCKNNHEKCRRDSEPWYPSRLLQLLPQGQKATLILSEDSPLTGPYITLSHRWGSQSYTKLMASTMKQLQSSIEVASLPQAFQDTMRIANHLGVSYIWIDALCIIQDRENPSDWMRESHDMDKIYSRALLNVSATMSRDGSESLFKERSLGPFLPSAIELDVDGRLQMYYVLDGNLWDDEIDNAPLNDRGWVYQERFLAHRIVHFGERQVAWECRELNAMEMFPEGLPRALDLSPINKSRVAEMMEIWNPQIQDQKQQSPSARSPELEFVKLWQNLVTQYTKCKLTYPSDKLVAFEGVANRMAEARIGDRYIVGMWEIGMEYNLAWWRSFEDREAFPLSETSYRAPSWSWASVDGEIMFPSTLGGIRAHFVDVLEFPAPAPAESVTDHGGRGRTYQAESQSLRIRGHCLRLDVQLANDDIVSFEVAGCCFLEAGATERGSSIHLEMLALQELSDLARRGRLFLLPLFATSYFLYGIVIEKIRGRCSHRRLGAVEIPIKMEPVPEEVLSEESSDATLASPGRSRSEAWAMIGPSKTTEMGHRFIEEWSMAAVRLIHYLQAPRRDRRAININ